MKKFLLLFVILTVGLSAQQYPRWFVSQGDLSCLPNVVAIVGVSTLYRDSAIAFGFRVGCDLLARYNGLQIKGGQTDWSTEAGVFDMGSKYEEEYDSSLTEQYRSTLKVLDSYTDKQKTLVLIGDPSCVLDKKLSEKISIEKMKQPAWVEALPADNRYYYGVGLSQEFFYEQSSWQTAERNAYMSLAHSMQVKLKSLQKGNKFEFQDIRSEDIEVQLHNIEVIARWRDVKRKIFYVLSRAKK